MKLGKARVTLTGAALQESVALNGPWAYLRGLLAWPEYILEGSVRGHINKALFAVVTACCLTQGSI